MNHQKILLIFSSCILILGWPNHARANEIIISANGSESENTVVVSENSQTSVEQSNSTTTQNDVSTNANTGGNTVEGTTNGDAGIQTGNVATDTTISNSANSSSVSTDCCSQQGTYVIVSNNGSGSVNNATQSSIDQNTITVTQHATITNIISGNAITGNNTANNNNGNVFIKTGNIFVNESIKNGPINISHVSVPQSIGGNKGVKIFGNGAESLNAIASQHSNTSVISVVNLADIINISTWNLKTGGNTASFNNGDVAIKTGDISHTSQIENGPINVNHVSVTCCNEEENPSPAPTPQTNAPTPQNASTPSGNGSSGNGNPHIGVGGPGDVLSAALGKILPATGTNWLFYATLANIVMLFIGVFLRLRSGRSPGLVFAR